MRTRGQPRTLTRLAAPMARKSLRPQLNQIRAWVRQGRTDAWIAHQLEVSAAELQEFRRQHGLSPDDEDIGSAEIDLRDEIEAEVEAAAAEAITEEPEPEQAGGDEEPDGGEAEGRPRRRRRRGRRGGRGRRATGDLEATFDHGERDGFGLWLDPAVQENPNYSEHWAGHREVTVTIEPDQIVIKRAESGDSGADD
jgi:hypothetical protein